MEGQKRYIQNFWDLDVYQRLSRLRKVILIKVIPKLPREERFDLANQMRRACKAACALLSEGFAKRFQIKHWQKYLTDTVGECNEMIDHLTVVKEVYGAHLRQNSIEILIHEYKVCVKQLLALGKSWSRYHNNKPPTFLNS